MKYRIKKIRREGWTETEDKLFRPVEDVTPAVPEITELPEGEPEIYIIDDTSDTEDGGTVVFTPPTPTDSAKDSPPGFFKTKEGKLIAALVGGFAILLILFTVIVIALSGGGEPDYNAGGSNTDHAHNYQTIVDKKATCTEKGVTKEKCSICGYITGEEIVDALGHKWKVDDKNSKEATCEEEGVEVRECERCSEKETVTLEPAEHDWKEDHSNQATCEEDGTVIKTCKTCGKRETETQQAKGHTWIQTTTEEATCETEGKINFRCASCTDTKTEVTAKKEHELSDPVRTEPTCALEGKEVAFCSLCRKNVTVVIEKLPHGDTDPATCESGEKCKVCGEEVSEPLGHTFEDGQCTVCKAILAYTGEESNITVGGSMQIGTGISLSADSCTADGGKVTLSFTVKITEGFTSAYAITPESIFIIGPAGERYDYTAGNLSVEGDLFNLPSKGSVPCTVSVEPLSAGRCTMYVIGENNVYHTCTFSAE